MQLHECHIRKLNKEVVPILTLEGPQTQYHVYLIHNFQIQQTSNLANIILWSMTSNALDTSQNTDIVLVVNWSFQHICSRGVL